MRHHLTLFAFLLGTATVSSCRKVNNTDPGAGCFPATPTVRQISNVQAAIKAAGDKFYIIEQGMVDTRLNPCTLPKAFQMDNLQVTVSGDVKLTTYGAGGPCCTENFVITKISK